jgi:hypothetical protein
MYGFVVPDASTQCEGVENVSLSHATPMSGLPLPVQQSQPKPPLGFRCTRNRLLIILTSIVSIVLKAVYVIKNQPRGSIIVDIISGVTVLFWSVHIVVTVVYRG